LFVADPTHDRRGEREFAKSARSRRVRKWSLSAIRSRSDEERTEALGALQKAEIEKWWPIIKAAHIAGE
jgi:hypothetical protein